MNAESELEAVGMAWGAAATGTRAATGSTGQGLSLMQESLAEISLARLPLVVLNMARGQGDYYQATRGGGHGDYRHLVLAPVDVPRRSSWSSSPSTWPTSGATRCWSMGDYYLAHTQESVDVAPLDSRAAAGRGLGARRLERRHRAGPSSSRSSARSSSATTSATTWPCTTRRAPSTRRPCCDGVAAHGRVGLRRRRRRRGGRLRHAGRATCATRCGSCASEGLPVGFVRPITLCPFPAAAVAAAAERARAVAVYEINTGQMIDDVRLAVLGRGPGGVHRRPEPRHLGLRHRARPRRRPCCAVRILDVVGRGSR